MPTSATPDNNEKEKTLYYLRDEDTPFAMKSGILWDSNKWRGEFLTDELYEGEKGRVHGGIITYLLDEAMARTVLPEYKSIATSNIQARFRNPAPVHEPLIVTAWITNKRRNLVKAGANVCLRNGTLIAEGNSTIYIISKK
jgi:acyl-coenzyme A thioesterase PaaI-like protein